MNYSNLKTHSYLLYLILGFCLFFPTKYILFHQVGLALLTVLTYFFLGANFAAPTLTGYYLFFLIIISSITGTFYYQTDPITNFTEIFRFLILFLTLSAFSNISKTRMLSVMINGFFIYSILTLLVSGSQFYKFTWFGGLSDIYYSDLHKEISLGISSRALGFSPGPGQNGSIMVFIYSFSLAQVFLNNDKVKPLLTCVSCLLVVLLSQSQTAFVATTGISFYAIVFSFFKFSNKRRKMLVPVAAGFTSAFVFIYIQIDNLRYLGSLFKLGLERNSYQARELKTARFFNMSTDNILSMIFGHGKDFFGSGSGAMDNEYIFIYGVYGLLVFLMIIGFYAYFSAKIWLVSHKHLVENKALLSFSFILTSGSIVAWPSAFILDTRILFLLAMTYVLYCKYDKAIAKKRADERYLPLPV